MADILKPFSKLTHPDDVINRIQRNIEDSLSQQKLINQQLNQQINFSGTNLAALSSSSDFRYVKLSNASQTVSGTLSQSAGDFSGSGQAIFNGGYKTMLLQMAVTSSFLSGTNFSLTPPFACTVPWSGSLAGMSIVAEGVQPNGGGKVFLKANVNGAIIANTAITASNSLTNPSIDFPRGLYPFGTGSLIQVTATGATLAQTNGSSVLFTGYVISLWGYM